jgi:site-specific DNA-methyltransferase (adenine-specific)
MSDLSAYEYHREDAGVVYLGNCLDVMAAMEPDSVDTIITDPPYGLEFMGVAWDTMRHDGKPRVRNDMGDFGSREHARQSNEKARIQRNKSLGFYEFSLKWTKAALRVAKPGAILLAFGGTRTHHRLWCAIEDAGWEIRDCMMWLYGQGFPKAADISKMIDKAAGAERESIGLSSDSANRIAGGMFCSEDEGNRIITAPATDAAKLWDGWKSALKPAFEPICLAMKPLDGTFAQNALKHGVAGLNIDGSRIDLRGDKKTAGGCRGNISGRVGYFKIDKARYDIKEDNSKGRYPSNLLLDEESARMLDEQSGIENDRPAKAAISGIGSGCGKPRALFGAISIAKTGYNTIGGASRFFYTAKASRAERGENNNHPTVKPLKLITYLCTLTATPTGGIILDPFAGSGTTGVAAKLAGRRFILIEKEPAYCEIAKHRLAQGVFAL